jgi:hypothetical protein
VSVLTEESLVPLRNNSIDNALAASDITAPQQPLCPTFALIDAVTMGPPANLAGLEEDALILEFGSLHAGVEVANSADSSFFHPSNWLWRIFNVATSACNSVRCSLRITKH